MLKRNMSNLSTSNNCISVLLCNNFSSIIFTVFPWDWKLHQADVFSFKLKQLRPIGEGDQELEKKLVQEELT
jgi:hypothetical protein